MPAKQVEYWSCGQDHDPRNWNWKPWQHLERLCRKKGLDDFALREILFEHLGRMLECECQVLFDGRELRKEALKRQFGILTAGRSDWWIETGTAESFSLDFRFRFGIFTIDEGLAGFSDWGGKMGIWTERMVSEIHIISVTV